MKLLLMLQQKWRIDRYTPVMTKDQLCTGDVYCYKSIVKVHFRSILPYFVTSVQKANQIIYVRLFVYTAKPLKGMLGISVYLSVNSK